MNIEKMVTGLLSSNQQKRTLLGQVVALAAKNPDDLHDQITSICQMTDGTYDEVAKVVVAVITGYPENSAEWLKRVTRSIRSVEADGPCRPNFILGVILGVFQGATWLSSQWKQKTPYEEALPQVIGGIVLYQERLLGENRLGKDYIIPDDNYKAQLSEAVKDCFRPGKDSYRGSKGIRLGCLHLASRIITEGLEERKRELRFTVLAELILNELSYAWFGMLSPLVRINTVYEQLEMHLYRACKAVSTE